MKVTLAVLFKCVKLIRRTAAGRWFLSITSACQAVVRFGNASQALNRAN